MTKNYFLFHCWGGDGRSCWSGWLADQLSVPGSGSRASGPGSRISGPVPRILSPDFPETLNPRLEAWLHTARSLVPRFEPEDDWVLIGHSLGCPTILRLLESFEEGEMAEAAILVAGFAKDLGIPEIRGFVDRDFDWDKINRSCGKFVVINSDDDPFIELSEGERLAKLLNTELITERGAGHINEGSGFTSYPRLLDLISRL